MCFSFLFFFCKTERDDLWNDSGKRWSIRWQKRRGDNHHDEKAVLAGGLPLFRQVPLLPPEESGVAPPRGILYEIVLCSVLLFAPRVHVAPPFLALHLFLWSAHPVNTFWPLLKHLTHHSATFFFYPTTLERVPPFFFSTFFTTAHLSLYQLKSRTLDAILKETPQTPMERLCRVMQT